MKTITAAEAKNSFGRFLDAAQREPVVVTKNNRPVGVFLSMQDLEDTIWAERALAAHREGYVGVDETRALFDRLKSADAGD
jgi:prevent-host-death family protein